MNATGNPNWVKNGSSPNPGGRPKTRHSKQQVNALLLNVVKRKYTLQQIERRLDKLSDKEYFYFFEVILPYIAVKQPTAPVQFEKLNDSDLDQLYNRVMDSLEKPTINLIPLKNGIGQETTTTEN
jgi:hypothetical protein